MQLDIGNPKIIIDWEAEGAVEIYQNIRTLLAIWKGEVPFQRNMGVDINILDEPLEIAKNRLTVDYIEQIGQYEPRARVSEVHFDADVLEGKLTPRVVIELAA